MRNGNGNGNGEWEYTEYDVNIQNIQGKYTENVKQ